MNYLIITIDALSKWYIDRIKRENSFFSFLENNTYCFNNMFSTGPFTEAAIRSFWAGEMPLDGMGCLSENQHGKSTFFDEFSKTHFMYYGELTPYFNHLCKVDNIILDREQSEYRAFEHIWNARLSHYISDYAENRFNNNDIWKIEWILERFFEYYSESKAVAEESNKYELNKSNYIEDILQNSVASSLYKALNSDLLYECKYRNIVSLNNQMLHELSSEEAIFIKKAKNLNIRLALSNDINSRDSVESILNGEKNRCIISNNDLLSHMRDENERFPKLKEEIDDFLAWYDSAADSIDMPFFAYIHNYDFHFPENFMNSRYENYESYQDEVKHLIELLDELDDSFISVSKQLSIKLIEKNLEYLWAQLEERDVFKDTCVIITADHGISNFMNPVGKSKSRWNYSRTNFNIPMYIKTPVLACKKNNDLISAKCFKTILQNVNDSCESNDLCVKNELGYLCTEWVNGFPDLERSPIKIGFRTNDWSITCQGMYHQAFSSLDILGIYDLKNDPDEINSLTYSELIANSEFEKAFQIMGEEWYRLIVKIVEDSVKYNSYIQVREYLSTIRNHYNDYSSVYRVKKDDLFKRARKIIVYGTNEKTINLLKSMPESFELLEIWGNINNCSKFLGHSVYESHAIGDDILLIICENNELEALKIIDQYMIKNYCFYSSIL